MIMAEQETPPQKEKATIEWIQAISGGNVDVEVSGKIFTIRPLTWEIEKNVLATTENMKLRGIPELVADREYTKLIVYFCLVDPKANESQVENMDVKFIKGIFDHVSNMSSTETSKKL